MALLGINAAHTVTQKKDVMDRILEGVTLANQILGGALKIPEYLQQRKAQRADIDISKAREERAEELHPLDVQYKKAQIAEKEADARPLTENEIQELQEKYEIPSVLLPNTVGEARAMEFLLSPKERKEIEFKERELSLKEREAADRDGKKKQLSANDIMKINEGNNIPMTLAGISKLISDNRDLFGPVGGTLRSINKYDARAQSVDAQLRAASQQFGRYMEAGVLRKEDEVKYRKMFPNLGDLPKVAEAKLGIVNTLLRNKQKSDLKAFERQGFDLEGLDLPPEIPLSVGDSGQGRINPYTGKPY